MIFADESAVLRKSLEEPGTMNVKQKLLAEMLRQTMELEKMQAARGATKVGAQCTNA